MLGKRCGRLAKRVLRPCTRQFGVVTREMRQTKVLKAFPIMTEYAKLHVQVVGSHSQNWNKLQKYRKLSPVNIAALVSKHVTYAVGSVSRDSFKNKSEITRDIADRAFASDKQVKFIALDRIC